LWPQAVHRSHRPRANGWEGGFQGGVDLWRGSFLPGHRDVAGVYVAFANSNIAVDGLVTNAAATGYVQSRTGTLGLNAYSAGGYWTQYGPSGWYLDAVVQGTHPMLALVQHRLSRQQRGGVDIGTEAEQRDIEKRALLIERRRAVGPTAAEVSGCATRRRLNESARQPAARYAESAVNSGTRRERG
jgi:hypothetical protein